MKILAIETSCDETAIALVEARGGLNPSTGSWPKFRILENLVASQIKIHRPYGGVVPNLAKREHQRNLPLLWQRIMNKELRIKGKTEFIIHKKVLNPQSSILNSVDLIAATVGPGLEPCLWTGINFTKNLYSQLKTHNPKLKIIGASHLEGHLYSFLLNPQSSILNTQLLFPAIALIISGGHTILILMKDLTHYKKLGETRDDAVGEAFDKVARLPRIVNIQDINMKPDPAKKNNELFTTCTAVTYKFLDAKAAAPADKAKKGAETKKKAETKPGKHG